ncbi:MAG: peroxiredoxin family protein [Acidobacteria bacterium]|jgi:peroxiredoxin|nr:peroxiredoxin family protein [Acidobacteriota bacterium]
MKNRFFAMALALLVLSGLLAAQAPAIKKAYLGQPMSDFELATLDGKTVKLSALKGRNVMLVFPRVFYAVDGDCSICGYQYAELADQFQAGKWKERFNLDVLFVFPFSTEVTRSWIARIPAMLVAVEEWKNPKQEDLKNEQVKRWMEIARQAFPKKHAFAAAAVPMPFPILLDEKRELSRGLDLFREEWSGGKGDQNIPSLFILDKEGIVRFKLIGQHTLDRPAVDYLEKIMAAVL